MSRLRSSASDRAWIKGTATEDVDPGFADLDAGDRAFVTSIEGAEDDIDDARLR